MKKYSQIFLSLFIIVIAIQSRADTNSPNGENEKKFGMQVTMTAILGKGEELAAIMLDASKLVSTLKGCQIYVVQLSTSEKDTVLITEVWDSEEDHKASLSIPKIRELIGAARPLIAGMAHHTAKPLGGVGI